MPVEIGFAERRTLRRTTFLSAFLFFCVISVFGQTDDRDRSLPSNAASAQSAAQSLQRENTTNRYDDLANRQADIEDQPRSVNQLDSDKPTVADPAVTIPGDTETRPILEGSEENRTDSRRSSSQSEVVDSLRRAKKKLDKDSNSYNAANPYKDLPALDDLYRQLSSRSDVALKRFGISIFQSKAPEPKSQGAVGPNYVLGPGDYVQIEIWGSTSQHLTRVVDHEGRVSLPDVGQLPVAGQTVSEAQEHLLRALKREYREVRVDLSIARLRSARVYVVGDVNRPGAFTVTGNATPLTALMAAGGPTEAGSMRRIQHMRGARQIAEIDLYDFLLRGLRTEFQPLADGDTLLVPPISAQTVVVGAVRRPAIYELKDENALLDILKLAGGVPVDGTFDQVVVDRIDPHGKRRTLTLDSSSGSKDEVAKFSVQDGDRITIGSILPVRESTVYLQGHVYHPGRRGYTKGMKARDILSSYAELMPEPSDRAEIVRLLPPTYKPLVIPVSLKDILDSESQVELVPFDTLRIYGRYERDVPVVRIQGDVLKPGNYPLSEGMRVSELVRFAGGLKRSALNDVADLTSYEVIDGDHIKLAHSEIQLGKALQGDRSVDTVLKPGDVVGIRQMTAWSDIGSTITVRGEVRYPGTFGISSGERLSSVLLRAGGFTADAYPYGAVLNRNEVRQLSEESKQILIQKLKAESLKVSAAKDGEDAKQQAETDAMRRQTMIDLAAEPASARLSIDISKNVDQWRGTSADIVVRPGDEIYIPKNMGFIRINGQVYTPTAVSYMPRKNAGWYLKNAGGVTRLADTKGIFIVRANGRIVATQGGVLPFRETVMSTVLQPGDTIVVPQKITTGSPVWRNLLQSAQVMSSLAITASVAGL